MCTFVENLESIEKAWRRRKLHIISLLREKPLSLFFLINFYWSIVDLQCCVSFSCTAKWISYTYTYIHCFLDAFPIQVITGYWVELPVLYNRFLSILYIVMCIYQSQYPNISLPISPLVTPRLFSTSVTSFLFFKQVHLYHTFRFHK